MTSSVLRIAGHVLILAFGVLLLASPTAPKTPPVIILGCLCVLVGLFALAATVLTTIVANRRQLTSAELTRQHVTYRPRLLGTSVDRTRGEHRAVIGSGEAVFERAAAANLRWEVKTRSGFRVTRVDEAGAFSRDAPVRTGEAAIIRFGPVRETVQVVRVVREPRRRGFAYGTLAQHPLIGEEAFLVEWNADDTVELVIRSFSRPNGLVWALAAPLVAIARQVVLRRYLRALVD